MRVLLMHDNYTVQGDAEVFFHEIGRLLEKNGHSVAKFCCAQAEDERERIVASSSPKGE
ncbi:MAG: hypothetical protein AAGH57_05295 [Pseudomonadota bacterium]